MHAGRGWWVVLAVAGVLAGCATAGPAGEGRPPLPAVTAPTAVEVPPLNVGTGMATAPAEPYIEGAAAAASFITVPMHALWCGVSAVVAGVFYAYFYPGDYAEDMKGFIAQNCAGPYVVTPAEIARPAATFPPRTLRVYRTGTVPVAEAVRQASSPR